MSLDQVDWLVFEEYPIYLPWETLGCSCRLLWVLIDLHHEALTNHIINKHYWPISTGSHTITLPLLCLQIVSYAFYHKLFLWLSIVFTSYPPSWFHLSNACFLGVFLELRKCFYMFSGKVWLLGFLVTECNQWFAPCCLVSTREEVRVLTWLDKLFFLTMKKVPSSSALVPICCLSGLLVLASVFHLFKNEPDCRFGCS